MYFKISFKVLFVVTWYDVTICWTTSPIQLFSTNWFVVMLSGSLTQLLWNGSLMIVMGCLSISPHYNCFTISANEFCECSSFCQSFTPWLYQFPSFQHMLLWLLNVNIDNNYHINWYILKFRQFWCCNNRINKFSSKHVMHFSLPRTFSRSLFGTWTYNIGYRTCILTSLTCCVLVPATCFVDLIVVICTTDIYFFVDMTCIKSMTCFTTISTSWYRFNTSDNKNYRFSYCINLGVVSSTS